MKETLPADFVHWTIVEGRGSNSDNRVRYGGINNMTFGHWYLFNVETASSAGETGIDDDHGLAVPAGRWICLEWKFDGGGGDAQLWADGTEHPQIHIGADVIKGAFTMPTFDSLYIGWGIYQAISKPYEVWIDDVAVDSQRIGCAP